MIVGTGDLRNLCLFQGKNIRSVKANMSIYEKKVRPSTQED